MKVTLALSVLLSVSCVPIINGDLIEDMHRFFVLIPGDEVLAMSHNFYQTDPAFALTYDFIHSPRCTEIILAVDALPEFRAYFDFVESKGIPGYYWLNKFRGFFGWPEFPHNNNISHGVSSRSYLDFVNAVLTILPVDDFIATWDDLIANSPQWTEMLAVFDEPEYKAVRSALIDNPTYINVDNELVSNGFDLSLFVYTIRKFFVDAYNNKNI